MKKIKRLQVRPKTQMNYVTVVQCNSYYVIQAMKYQPKANIRMHEGNMYEILKSGEIKECKPKGETKAMSLQSFKRSMERLFNLILENVNDNQKNHYHFITLTYNYVMRDLAQLKKDWESFWDDLNDYVINELGEKNPPKYILVREPQGNGSFHFHVILIWSHKAPFLNNEKVIARCWGHGYTHITGVKFQAYYLAKYLTNMAKHMTPADYRDAFPNTDLPEATQVSVIDEESGGRTQDERVLNSRIALYPRDMRVYDTSRGLKRPTKIKIDNRNLAQVLRDAGEVKDEYHCAVMEADGDLPKGLSEDEMVEQAVQVISRYICRQKREIHNLDYAIREKEYQESLRNQKK